MKNSFKILKTIGLCVLLMGMAGWAKGASYYVSLIKFNSVSPTSVVYGSTGVQTTYNLSLTTAGNGAGFTPTFNITGLPNGTTYSFTNSTGGALTKISSITTITVLLKITYPTSGDAISYNFTINETGGSPTYSISTPSGFEYLITPKALTITGAAVTSKVYDGTTAATITGTLTGVITGDAVTLNGTGTFVSANVGTGISVTPTCTLSGVKAGNYTLTQPTGLMGNITKPTAVTWSGTTSTNWATASNWTPPYLPDATIDVTVPSTTNKPAVNASIQAVCKNITINSGASLTINPQGSLTVSGNLTNNAGATGLSLVSDVTAANVENGTGSLIVTGTASGSATLTRAMKTTSEHYSHLVTSPLGGQSIQNFLSNNATIQTGTAHDGKDYTDYRGMRQYNPSGNKWSEYFQTSTSGSLGNLLQGIGYSIMIRPSQAHNVVFTGTLPSGDITISGLAGGFWNCIGNPYTSAITINSNGLANTRFLENNISNLDAAFVCVYVWDPANSQTAYTSVSNATSSYTLQEGQAFMVKMASGKTSLSFTRAMQVHNVSLELKSTDDVWPTIQLQATADSINSSTVIAFHEGMTNGLDISYDAGLLKAGSPIDLYTRLVDDYGIPFAIQALPSDQYNQLVIPVGVDYTKGGQVSFSARGMYLPSSCRPILEDRLTGIITDLNNKTYTTDLLANTAGTGRFYLHTSYMTTGAAARDKSASLSVWAVGNNEIHINGKINNGAIVSLYDLQGRLILTHVMREGIRHCISLPAVNQGIYLLQLHDQQQVQVLKVAIGQ
jgi:hypothetical protein